MSFGQHLTSHIYSTTATGHRFNPRWILCPINRRDSKEQNISIMMSICSVFPGQAKSQYRAAVSVVCSACSTVYVHSWSPVSTASLWKISALHLMFVIYFRSTFQCIQADTEEGRLRQGMSLSVYVQLLVFHVKMWTYIHPHGLCVKIRMYQKRKATIRPI